MGADADKPTNKQFAAALARAAALDVCREKLRDIRDTADTIATSLIEITTLADEVEEVLDGITDAER